MEIAFPHSQRVPRLHVEEMPEPNEPLEKPVDSAPENRGLAGRQAKEISPDAPNCRQMYLDLMKRCLVNSIYGTEELHPVRDSGIFGELLGSVFPDGDVQLMRSKPFDFEARSQGRDWPPTAHTMIGLKRLNNLQFCIERVLADGVPGELMETGVWRGGATIFMKAVLNAYGVKDRLVWVADSFQGLPEPDAESYPADRRSTLHQISRLAIPRTEVMSNFERYGLLDENVRFLEGWFRDTLPSAPIESLAVLRLDGDLYESTMDALQALYPQLSPGGYLIVDDYYCLESCRLAVDDYREQERIVEPIERIDWTGVFWRKVSSER